MDLSNHVALPREDYQELVTTAFDQPSPTLGDRAATTVQTTLVFAGIGAVGTAVYWGCVKATDWLEERRIKRERVHRDIHQGK